MNDEPEPAPELDQLASESFMEARKLSRRLRRIAIANILRGVRRPNGKELSDVAVASRVLGSVPSEVRQVRQELDRNGVLQDELDGPEEVGGDKG